MKNTYIKSFFIFLSVMSFNANANENKPMRQFPKINLTAPLKSFGFYTTTGTATTFGFVSTLMQGGSFSAATFNGLLFGTITGATYYTLSEAHDKIMERIKNEK